MKCPLVLTVFAVTQYFPACRQRNSLNLVSVGNIFQQSNRTFNVTCNTTDTRADLYKITGDKTIVNVTTSKSQSSVIAEISEVSGNNIKESYCCCRNGNCRAPDQTLGSTTVFTGNIPSVIHSIECILNSQRILRCIWKTLDPCIQWNVKYTSSSVRGSCSFTSPFCEEYCPTTPCYIRTEDSDFSFCPQCEVYLNDKTVVYEVITFHFIAQNLWGTIENDEKVSITEEITILDPTRNLRVLSSNVTSLSISFLTPDVPKPFDGESKIVCWIKATHQESTLQKEVIVNSHGHSVSVNVTFNDMIPASKYYMTVRCRLNNSSIWSKDSLLEVCTSSARPLSGPSLEPDAFTYTRSRLILYLKDMDIRVSRGEINGYRVETSDNIIFDNCTLSNYTLSIPYSGTGDLDLRVHTRNEKGLSLTPTYLRLENITDYPDLAVITERGNATVRLKVYSPNNGIPTRVKNIFWCKGELVNGTVICQTGLQTIKADSNLSVTVDGASDKNWHFGLTTNITSGIIWEKGGCTFYCINCDPSKPPKPIIRTVNSSVNALELQLMDNFCDQNEWTPYGYHVTYKPTDKSVQAINMTVLATPFLKTIMLKRVVPGKDYDIQIRSESSAYRLSNATTLVFKPLKDTSKKEEVSKAALTITVATAVALLVLFALCILYRKYKSYNPLIDDLVLDTSGTTDCVLLDNTLERNSAT